MRRQRRRGAAWRPVTARNGRRVAVNGRGLPTEEPSPLRLALPAGLGGLGEGKERGRVRAVSSGARHRCPLLLF